MSVITGSASGPSRFNTLPPPSSSPPTVDSPRLGTPNDPKFDSAEPDDPDSPPLTPTSDVWEEQYNLFGFAPASTAGTALYHDPQHLADGEVSQRSGVSADRAWKKTHGNPEVAIAIVDTGIDWTDADLRLKVHLNRNELPIPMGPQCAPNPGQYDCNGDGSFNVADYDGDPRVSKSAGTHGIPNVIDAEDLIVAFSDGIDADGNAYVDDIAGWDFFDDDNDPYDASSYSSANFHGSGRAGDAAAEVDNGNYSVNPPTGDGAGVCPLCQVMVLRLWDSFVAPADTYGMATLYAADNGAKVEEAALGVLQNSKFSQAATEYAFHKGVALMEVSSDLNTSNHN
ncbi:MAG TPA: S8 family serine peptidase, partial [Mycobacteriales bacterium]|nr:S8 family serine peptidase [Mycobacteriales bacterium]